MGLGNRARECGSGWSAGGGTFIPGPEVLVKTTSPDRTAVAPFHALETRLSPPLPPRLHDSRFLIEVLVLHPREMAGDKIPMGNMPLIPC